MLEYCTLTEFGSFVIADKAHVNMCRVLSREKLLLAFRLAYGTSTIETGHYTNLCHTAYGIQQIGLIYYTPRLTVK
jgi:hypothetical protein